MGSKLGDETVTRPHGRDLQTLPRLDKAVGSQHSANATCHSPKEGLVGAPRGCLPADRAAPHPHPLFPQNRAGPTPPHHLIGLHGQLHLIITVLLTLAVGALDLLQVLHTLIWRKRLHRGDILRSQDVDLCLLI